MRILPRRTRILKVAVRLGLALAVLAAAGVALGYVRLRQSRPVLEGTLAVPAVRARLTIERDAAGTPTITAANRRDASFGLGFLHAQERIFQMDVARRAGAGRLSELFGKDALQFDRLIRVHRFRNVVRQSLGRLDAEDREVLKAYTAGVNAGIQALGAPPFEYQVLGGRPEPWREEDGLLVVFYLYMLLQDSQGDQEYNLLLLHEALPRAAAEFLSPAGIADWDAPLTGTPVPAVAMPGAGIFSARGLTVAENVGPVLSAPQPRGSNGWALSGRFTGHGGALVANDMHLGFGLPNAFLRATLRYGGAGGAEQRVSGITVPGFPLVVAGTNGHIAWGFTNSAADWVDLVLLDQAGLPAGRFRTPTGIGRIATIKETLRIKGEAAETLRVETTPWGPVVRTTADGRRFAQQWVAHHPQAVNLGLRRLETARTAQEALDAASRTGIPAQNFMVGDADGNIGWTIAGPIPRRSEHLTGLPVLSSRAGGWTGWLAPEEYPRVYNPEGGRIWTANARVVDGEDLRKLGYGYYIVGARAHQIRERLAGLEHADEAEMLRMQMDDEALFLARWRDLLLATLDAGGHDDAQRRRMRDHVQRWQGRADPASVGYRLIRTFREKTAELAFAPFVSVVRQKNEDFEFPAVGDQQEGPLWELVTRRPPHLLHPRFATWEELLARAADRTLTDATADGAPLDDYTWGSANVLAMRHPFSPLMPPIRWWVDMPAQPLHGDLWSPLAQLGGHGPVMRMVVAPGHERRGVLALPGGPTAHPLAPYYGARHEEWLNGKPTPLLAGRTRYSLVLVPDGAMPQTMASRTAPSVP